LQQEFERLRQTQGERLERCPDVQADEGSQQPSTSPAPLPRLSLPGHE
jgi:hypothetical protein